MPLDAVLTAAIANGLETVSLSRLGQEWQANARREGSDGWSVRIDEDPLRAVEKAVAWVAGAPEPCGSIWEAKGAMERLEAAVIELTAIMRRRHA